MAHTSRVRLSNLLSWPAWCAAALLFSAPFTASLRAEDQPGAPRAYLVLDDKSGHILLQSHATDKLPVASLTKIATAVVVLDWVNLTKHPLDTKVSIPGSVIAQFQDNPIGFQPGDEISLRDLLYAALLQSDAIAAETLAVTVGRELPAVEGEAKQGGASERRFVTQMNALARHLHMERTLFLNPVGTDVQQKPYSTAADLARLSRFALKKADFRFFISQKERRISFTREAQPQNYLLRNTNELLGDKHVDGGKTGTTARAGQCLMITSERPAIVWQDGAVTYKTTRRLIIIILGAPDRFREAAGLIDEAEPVYDRWLAAGHPMDPETTL